MFGPSPDVFERDAESFVTLDKLVAVVDDPEGKTIVVAAEAEFEGEADSLFRLTQRVAAELLETEERRAFNFVNDTDVVAIVTARDTL